MLRKTSCGERAMTFYILPTRGNLRRRKIIEESKCPLCEREEETNAHILWFCPSAMDVWSAGAKTFQKCSYKDLNFLQLAEKMLGRCTIKEFIHFVGTARRIWLRRNEVVHGGRFWHPGEIIQQVQTSI